MHCFAPCATLHNNGRNSAARTCRIDVYYHVSDNASSRQLFPALLNGVTFPHFLRISSLKLQKGIRKESSDILRNETPVDSTEGKNKTPFVYPTSFFLSFFHSWEQVRELGFARFALRKEINFRGEILRWEEDYSLALNDKDVRKI